MRTRSDIEEDIESMKDSIEYHQRAVEEYQEALEDCEKELAGLSDYGCDDDYLVGAILLIEETNERTVFYKQAQGVWRSTGTAWTHDWEEVVDMMNNGIVYHITEMQEL